MAAKKTLLEEAIEGSHYGGVSERTIEQRNHVPDIAFSARPENFHQFKFEAAQSQGGGGGTTSSDSIFEEANHNSRIVALPEASSKERGRAGARGAGGDEAARQAN